MAFDYTKSAATAQRLIKNFGQEIPIQKFIETFDPVSGKASDIEKVTSTLVGVSLPFSSNNAERLNDKLLESLAQGKLRKILCSPKDATGEDLSFGFPAPGHVIMFDNETFMIIGMTTLSPGFTKVMHTVIGEKCSLSAAQLSAPEAD